MPNNNSPEFGTPDRDQSLDDTLVPSSVTGVSEPDFRVGEVIDNQFLVDDIAYGGMSIVYFVTDQTTHRRYVLKTLSTEKLRNDAAAVARFQQEALVWINLEHHPNIVQAMTFLKRSQRPMLLLEYIDGPCLSRVLKSQKSLPVLQVVRWGLQLCAAMEYVHAKSFPNGDVGTLHRDIKPANVLLTRECVIKLTDFGLAKLQSGSVNSVAGQFAGTLAYSSPEQLRSTKDVDRASDVFSFGVMLFEMLTGNRPFPGTTHIEVIEAVERCQPDFRSVPGPLVPLLRRCLAREPRHRWQSFAEISGQLTGLEESDAPLAGSLQCSDCGFLRTSGDICVVCGCEGIVKLSLADTSMSADPVMETSVEYCECVPAGNLHLKFCPRCGREQQRAFCERCSTWNSSSNAFCNRCGETLR